MVVLQWCHVSIQCISNHRQFNCSTAISNKQQRSHQHFTLLAFYEGNHRSPVTPLSSGYHDDVINWKHFPRYWPFVRGIHWSPVNSPHKGQWRGALMFSLICVWTNGWEKNGDAGDLRRHRAYYDVTVMMYPFLVSPAGYFSQGGSCFRCKADISAHTLVVER